MTEVELSHFNKKIQGAGKFLSKTGSAFNFSQPEDSNGFKALCALLHILYILKNYIFQTNRVMMILMEINDSSSPIFHHEHLHLLALSHTCSFPHRSAARVGGRS